MVTDLKSQYGADYEALSSFVEYGTAPVADNFKSVSPDAFSLVLGPGD
jgi:hypothetical protein